MCRGDSARRGVFTFFEGVTDRPVRSTSLSPWGKSFEERLTSAARWATAALTTKSPVASTLASVSFFEPSLLRLGANTTIGGSAPKALKKLKGARFTRPSTSMLVTHAMGRGVTQEINKR